MAEERGVGGGREDKRRQRGGAGGEGGTADGGARVVEMGAVWEARRPVRGAAEAGGEGRTADGDAPSTAVGRRRDSVAKCAGRVSQV